MSPRRKRSERRPWVPGDLRSPSNRRRLGLVALSVAALSVSFWSVDRIYNAPGRRFRRLVHVGMAKAQIRRIAGDPREVLTRGMEQLTWGDPPVRVIQDEAWVYPFSLGGVNRFTLLIRAGKVDVILFDHT